MSNEITNKPTLRLLLILSGLFWLCSLPFLTYTFKTSSYNSNEYTGLGVLMVGWLAPLMLNFAWYSNLFIFYIFIQFFNFKKSLIIATTSLLLLSHTSYLHDSIMVNENGNTASIYGFGLGYVLWFTSIYILTIAVGLRNQEAHPDSKNSRFILYGGIILLYGNTLFTIIKSTIDYTTASSLERQHLLESGTIYKRGAVCTKEYKTKTFSQPVNTLEINANTTDEKFFHNLDWEYLFYYYNAIQIDGYRDQRTNETKTSLNKIYKIVPTGEKPDARLNLSFENNKLSAQLIDLRNNENLFNDVWTTKVPSFSSYKYDECSRPTPYDLLKEAQPTQTDLITPSYFTIESFQQFSAPTEIIENITLDKNYYQNKIISNCANNIQSINQIDQLKLVPHHLNISKTYPVLKSNQQYFLLTYLALSCNQNKIHLFDNNHIVTLDLSDSSKQMKYYITNINSLPFRIRNLITAEEDNDILKVQFYDPETQMINEVILKLINQK